MGLVSLEQRRLSLLTLGLALMGCGITLTRGSPAGDAITLESWVVREPLAGNAPLAPDEVQLLVQVTHGGEPVPRAEVGWCRTWSAWNVVEEATPPEQIFRCDEEGQVELPSSSWTAVLWARAPALFGVAVDRGQRARIWQEQTGSVRGPYEIPVFDDEELLARVVDDAGTSQQGVPVCLLAVDSPDDTSPWREQEATSATGTGLVHFKRAGALMRSRAELRPNAQRPGRSRWMSSPLRVWRRL